MLASHSSGLVREPESVRVTAKGPIHLWEDKVIASMPDTSFKTKPMTGYSYSNIGYAILGLAGSRVAEQPYMSMVEQRIFEPLAMTSSTFVIETEEMKQRLAVGYVRNSVTRRLSSTVPTAQHAGRGYKVPNGGVYSTAGDMAKFAAAMMGETETEILTEEMRKQMLAPQPPALQYGLGFKLVESDDWSLAGHSGSVAGYRADLKFDLTSKWGVAVLATSRFNPPVSLLKDLVDVVDGAEP